MGKGKGRRGGTPEEEGKRNKKNSTKPYARPEASHQHPPQLFRSSHGKREERGEGV